MSLRPPGLASLAGSLSCHHYPAMVGRKRRLRRRPTAKNVSMAGQARIGVIGTGRIGKTNGRRRGLAMWSRSRGLPASIADGEL